MSAFEYIFAFYSLILGLAAAEVVQGFAEMWRDRQKVRVGVATPIFALCVLLGVMNAWITFWARRDTLDVGAEAMLLAVSMALPYVFVSRLMFPRVGESATLEEHFLMHRRLLLVGLAGPPLIGRLYGFIAGAGFPTGFAGVYFAARILLPFALVFVTDPRWIRVGLIIMALLMIAGLFR